LYETSAYKGNKRIPWTRTLGKLEKLIFQSWEESNRRTGRPCTYSVVRKVEGGEEAERSSAKVIRRRKEKPDAKKQKPQENIPQQGRR